MDQKRFETSFFIALILFALTLVIFIFLPYLGAIVVAIALTVLFHPIYGWLKGKMPQWEKLSSFLTVFFSVIIIFVPLALFGFQILQEAQGLYNKLTFGETDPTINFLHTQVNNLLPWLNIDLNQSIKQLLGILVGNLGIIFSKITGVAMSAFLAFITFYYLLRDSAKLEEFLIRIAPLSEKNSGEILSKLHAMADSTIKGSLVVAVIQGILVGLGFFIFGIPNPVLWGTIAIIAALIPFLGTAIVVIPGIISLFLSGDIVNVIGFTLWGFLLVGLVDNFLRPYLIERKVKIHPLLVLFSVLGGFYVFGPTGFILGPLALSLLLTLLEIYPSLILNKK